MTGKLRSYLDVVVTARIVCRRVSVGCDAIVGASRRPRSRQGHRGRDGSSCAVLRAPPRTPSWCALAASSVENRHSPSSLTDRMVGVSIVGRRPMGAKVVRKTLSSRRRHPRPPWHHRHGPQQRTSGALSAEPWRLLKREADDAVTRWRIGRSSVRDPGRTNRAVERTPGGPVASGEVASATLLKVVAPQSS
jgi:hypothetical protein